MRKIILPILIVFLLVCSVFAQTAQTITLKPGFNFVSFTSSISLTPAQLKAQTPVVEDVYLFSAAAGSFLSANDGTLSTLAAGKGYIVKSSAASDTPLSISGDAIQTIGNINIKTGFNLIGFSKIPSTTSTFKSLMNVYTSIKGIYKWSPAAGSFIQVVRDNSGAVTLLDGADPSFKAGESYFFNLTEDTTINYDGTDIILGSGPPAPVAKTLEITGTVGASTTTAPSYSVARAIDLSTMQLSVYDEINNASVEGAVVTATGANTFKATLPVAIADRYLSVLVKNSENKVIYKSFLGRVPKATEVTENTVKISNIKVSDESTARAIIVLENRAKIPVTAVIAKTSVDASIAKTDFALALEEHIAGLEDRVPELKLAVNLIANVLTTAGVDAAIRQKVTEFTFSESSKLLSSYVSLLQDANTLQTVNNISVPTQLTIGSKQITAQSTQVEIYETVVGINDTIGQRVEMPVLNPPPGRYDNPISITMTCTTPNANIVYDYGDGNPGITYTAPVSINKTCTLNVAGFRSDWPMSWHSKFVNATYTIGPGTGGETTETRVLSSITLDRTSEAIVVTTEKYYLSNVKISTHYTNGDSKEVQATRWEMVSAPGSFSDSDNSYYLWNKTGDAIFNAVYSESGIEKKIEFKLMVRTQEDLDKLVPLQLTLSKTTDSVQIGGIYDLSKIIVTVHYGDGSTKAVQSTWKIISGGGVVNNNIYIVSETANQVELNCTYSENGYTIQSSLFLNTISSGNVVINPSNITVNPSETTKFIYNNISFTIPAGSVTATGEISFSDIDNTRLNILPGQNIIRANISTPISNLIIRIPVGQGATSDSLHFLCSTANGEKIICPPAIIEDTVCIFIIGKTSISPDINSPKYQLSEEIKQLINETKFVSEALPDPTYSSWTPALENFWNDIRKNKRYVKINWPYYYQQHPTACWLASWLMLMKGYKRELLPEYNSITKLAYNTTKEFGVWSQNQQVRDKLRYFEELLFCFFEYDFVGITRKNGMPMEKPFYCSDSANLCGLLIEKLSQGKPVMVWSDQHACIVYGYEMSEDAALDNAATHHPKNLINYYTTFYVHDPGRGPEQKVTCPSRSLMANDFGDLKILYGILYIDKYLSEARGQIGGFGGEYLAVAIDSMPADDRPLITTHMPIEGISFSQSNYAKWNEKVPDGYSWYYENKVIDKISDLRDLALHNTLVTNTDAQTRNINYKLSICDNQSTPIVSTNLFNIDLSINNIMSAHFGGKIGDKDGLKKLEIDLLIEKFNFELLKKHLSNETINSNYILKLEIENSAGVVDKFETKFVYNFVPPEINIFPYVDVYPGNKISFYAKNNSETIPTLWRIIKGSGTVYLSDDKLNCNYQSTLNEVGKLYYENDEEITIEAYNEAGTLATRSFKIIRPKLKKIFIEQDDGWNGKGSYWSVIYDRYYTIANGGLDMADHFHGKYCHIHYRSSYPFVINATYNDGLLDGFYSERYTDFFSSYSNPEGIRREGNYVMGSKEGIWKEIPYLNGISAGMTSDTLELSGARDRLNTNEYLNNKFVREILPQ